MLAPFDAGSSINRQGQLVYTMCGELSLENPPPFSSLSTHQGPSLQDGELPFSRLLDPRIAEVVLGHMKDQDDYVTRRRNVGRFNKPGKETEDSETEKAKKAKARAKAKASAAGSSHDAWRLGRTSLLMVCPFRSLLESSCREPLPPPSLFLLFWIRCPDGFFLRDVNSRVFCSPSWRTPDYNMVPRLVLLYGRCLCPFRRCSRRVGRRLRRVIGND